MCLGRGTLKAHGSHLVALRLVLAVSAAGAENLLSGDGLLVQCQRGTKDTDKHSWEARRVRARCAQRVPHRMPDAAVRLTS